MIAPAENRRLAIAAPVMLLAIGSALLALAARPAELLALMLVAAAVLPALIGWWVFKGRPPLSRALLATWAPAGEVLLSLVMVLVMRPSGVSQALFFIVIAGPVLVLLLFGAASLRGQGRHTRTVVVALWVAALAEVAAAIPLSERFGSVGDMRSLAGVVIMLFAPAAALGAWGGLALAARVPEPVRPGQTGATAERPPEESLSGGSPVAEGELQ